MCRPVGSERLMLPECHRPKVFRSAEVLPLNVKRPRDSSSDESAPEEDDSEDQQTAEPARKKSRIPKDHQPAPARPGLTSRFNKPATAEENGISASEASDPASDSDDAEEGWGNAYHVSRREVEEGPWQPRKPKKGAKRNKDEDELEMDPEQAELAEALRLQKIQRQHLDADDFGHIPVATAAAATTNIIESQSQKQELSAHQQQQQQLSFDSREAAIAHLLATSPLLLSLLNDFQDQATHARGLEAALRDISPASPLRALQTLHLQVVQSYLAVLAFWLRLALQGQQDTELGQNVFQRLVQLREGMQGLQEAGLDFDEPDSGDVYAGLPEDSEDEEDDLDSDELGSALEDDLDDERLQELMQQRDLLKMLEREGLSVKDIQAARAGDSESSDDAEHVGVESDQEPTKPVPAPEGGDKKKKKRRRRSKNNKTESQPVTSAPQPVLQLAPPESRDDFLEPSVLSTGDAADKKNKRHSLRFHAAQVASTANRRSTAAEARRQGGDADVPYVSKEQLRREAQKKAAARQEKELRARGEMPDQQDDYAEEAQAGDDGYYDLVQSSKGAAKQAKKEAYDQQRLEDRCAFRLPSLFVSILP